jgi:hypothetical protein
MGLKKAWPITLQERLPVPLEVDLIWVDDLLCEQEIG